MQTLRNPNLLRHVPAKMTENTGSSALTIGTVALGLAGFLSLVCCSTARAAPQDSEVQAQAQTQAQARQWHHRTATFYRRNWGVDLVEVRPVSSGTMLAFRYKVLDPVKAQPLNDRRNKAYLRDDASGAVFAVPAMENIGELRTGAAPEVNRIYYMIFGNPAGMVKPGNRVSIIAGNFHADGMVVTP
jgi:hypothetical protein